MDPGIRYPFSHINTASDEYFFSSPARDVLDLRELGPQISTENKDKRGFGLLVLNFVDSLQKEVVLSHAH